MIRYYAQDEIHGRREIPADLRVSYLKMAARWHGQTVEQVQALLAAGRHLTLALSSGEVTLWAEPAEGEVRP